MKGWFSMKSAKKALAMFTVMCLLSGMATVASAEEAYPDAHTIVLSSVQNEDGTYAHSAVYDGEAVAEYDYTWHADPSEEHDEVKNSPAEYYTGTEPDADDAVYIAHDIYYYPELEAEGFTKVQYDDDQEWAYYYTADGYTDYIFSTLPVVGSSIPTDMMHTEEEAYQNAVLHITEAGLYRIEGEWHGQIWIDLGDTDDTFSDPEAKVTIILNGVDVTCTVAPALVFYSVYECDNTWEDQSAWSKNVDTSDAGANVIVADGTVNHFTGENIYRILKTKYKDGDGQNSNNSVALQKKRMKIDGAFYSYVSMNVSGGSKDTGILNITAGYEGLDTELHLTLNGGNINIYSQDDGINVNEDGVSVVTINGGALHILAGLGSEGDGIDSNGFLVINGGTVIAMANPAADSGLDSDCGSYINGGTVVALGSTMDWAEADDSNDSGQVTMNLQFASSQSADEAIILTDTENRVIFAYDPDKDEVAGTRIRSYQGAVISCEALEVGETYFVYIGGDVNGTEVAGIYDPETVTGFTDEAKQQGYTGTDVGGMGRPGGGAGGGADGLEPPERPDDGMDPGNRGDGVVPPDGASGGLGSGNMGDGVVPPDGVNGGFDPGDREDSATPPEMPDGGFDGTTPPNGGDFDGTTPPDEKGDLNTGISLYFTMADKVNAFSGVRDYTGGSSDPEPGSSSGSGANTAASDSGEENINPQTGDNWYAVRVFMWMLISGTVTAGMAVYGKRKAKIQK